MKREKKVKYYVVIVDGKPLSGLLSDSTAANRSKIEYYKQFYGIGVREAVSEDFQRQKSFELKKQQQKFHRWFTERIHVSN